MRLLDRATCDSNHQRFIRRIIESETVYYLANSDGVAYSCSHDDEETTILLFWSDAAYARQANLKSFGEFEVHEMSLFDFLYRWLPGMTGDGVLAGPNWTYDLIGVECEAFPLREDIEDQMSEELLESYSATYTELTHN